MNNNIEKQLTDMYAKDTEALMKEIEELKKDRDLWKNRCLGAEAEKAQAQRQLRHV